MFANFTFITFAVAFVALNLNMFSRPMPMSATHAF